MVKKTLKWTGIVFVALLVLGIIVGDPEKWESNAASNDTSATESEPRGDSEPTKPEDPTEQKEKSGKLVILSSDDPRAESKYGYAGYTLYFRPREGTYLKEGIPVARTVETAENLFDIFMLHGDIQTSKDVLKESDELELSPYGRKLLAEWTTKAADARSKLSTFEATGNYLLVPHGTPAYASEVVFRAGEWGITAVGVVIKHQGERITVYAHRDSLVKKRG